MFLPIAKEGLKPLLILLGLFFFFLMIDSAVYILFLALFIVALIFFRDPQREPVNEGEDALFSPIDGYVADISYELESVSILIEQKLFGAHILRSPIKGVLVAKHKLNGANIKSTSKYAKKLNSQIKLYFQANNREIQLELLSSTIGYGFDVYKDINESVNYCERIGFFPSGVLRLTLPASFKSTINIGDELKAGETLLGYVA